MKKILFFLLLSLIGCSSSHYDQFEDYEVISFDSITDYYLIILKDSNHKEYLVLSEKFGAGIDRPPFKKYKEIKPNKTYRIKLIPQDSTFVVERNVLLFDDDPYQIYMGDSLFISNDTIMQKVYMSKNFFDRFVEIIDD